MKEGRGDFSAMSSRYTARLKAWGIFAGETLHGNRGGGSLHLLMRDKKSPADVDAHVGWAPPQPAGAPERCGCRRSRAGPRLTSDRFNGTGGA